MVLKNFVKSQLIEVIEWVDDSSDTLVYRFPVEGKEIKNAEDVRMYLLNDALDATVGGDALGSPCCVRISYATSEANLNKAIDRITKALSQLS